MYQASPDLDARPGHARGVPFPRALATVAVAGWALVALGAALRLVRFGDNRALWHDEAMLALNVLDRGFLELLRPLDYTQAAPPLFLLLSKLAVAGLGETEYALRLVPLLAGILALVLFRSLTARVLPGLGGLVALGLFAVAEPLVYWGAEAKQYSLDVLAAVALLYVAAEPLLTGRMSRRRAAILGVLGAFALVASYASVFVLAGIACALLLGPVVAGRRPSAGSLAVAGSWFLGVAALLLVVIETTADVRAALALHTWNSDTPLDTARDAWRALSYPGPFARTTAALAAAAAVLGAVSLRRRCPTLLAALGVTIAATAVAAQLDLYPFFERFVLFLVPPVLLLVGAGVHELREVTAGRTRVVWLTVLVLLVLYPAGTAAGNLVSPPKLEEIRDVLRPLEERWRPGDTLFVASLTQPALAYYAQCEACGVLRGVPTNDLRQLVLEARTRDSAKGLGPRPRLVIGDVDHVLPFPEVASRFAPLDGEPRAWVLLSSGWSHGFVGFVLDCMGRRVESFESTNAVVYLYDFSRRPAATVGCPGG